MVESVRDGATLRLLLLPSMHYITMMLTGVRCPMMRAGPDSTSDTEEHAEEHAEEHFNISASFIIL